MSSLKVNERSEAIELIKESQRIFDNSDLIFKEASGEQSLSGTNSLDSRANTLFPDVLYYEDVNQNRVALGWELKMPNTDINDGELFSNAVDKANRLKTNAFVLWNFKQVIVYYRDKNDDWKISRHWDDLLDNSTRQDVVQNRGKWKTLLLEVILHLNGLFIEQVVTTVSVLSSAESIATDIAEKYSDELANFYLRLGDRSLEITIKKWFETELLEFSDKKVNEVSIKEKAKIFSKSILINWINRVTFSNFIKDRHNTVKTSLQYLLNENRTFEEIAEKFNLATESSDFYTILYCDKKEMLLSANAEMVVREYASFLNKKEFRNIDQKDFQTTLENIVEVSKRELMGLYTTPKKLASLLVQSSVANLNSFFIDPCVGSGTIANTAMSMYANSKGVKEAHEHVWASDKYKMPLQIANISMSSKDSLNLPNIVFQKDLLSLPSLSYIDITNPSNGDTIRFSLPKFDYVVSNLPFIRSERIDDSERNRMMTINEYLKSKNIPTLNLKSDWYQFGIIGIESLLKDNGVAAVIVSNSWLKTKNKYNYIQTLFELFEVNKIIISGEGRWFQNAEVVTTIIILTKKKSENNNVNFIKLNKDIKLLSTEEIENISDSLLINDKSNSNLSFEVYSKSDINSFISNGLSLNVLFNNMSWFKKFLSKTVPMKTIFDGKRGVKSTNDTFFYNPKSIQKIEPQYIKKLLKTPTSVSAFYAEADAKVFFVRKTKEELKKESIGAFNYIEKFEGQPKTKSQFKLNYWYQYPEPIYGDFVTSLNPDKRLFWSLLPSNLIVNQRLTVFKVKDNITVDKRLLHALLNTYFGQFMIEATGFGRGLGVLDTTKNGILDSVMLDYRHLNKKSSEEIIERWEEISRGHVPNVLNQLHEENWMNYNRFVLTQFGLEENLSELVSAFESAVKLRLQIKV